MLPFFEKTILARRTGDEFAERSEEFAALVEHAHAAGSGLIIASAPRTGATELLLQTYDAIFREPNGPVPIYFAFEAGDEQPEAAARRFVTTFVTQLVAYRSRDPLIIHASPGMTELSRLASAGDAGLIDELLALLADESGFFDGQAFVNACFGIPLRAAARGVRLCIFLDDIHIAATTLGSHGVDAIAASFQRGSFPFVFSARRRFALAESEIRRIPLEPLSTEATGRVIESAAARSGVAVNESVRDLFALRCGGDLVAAYAFMKLASRIGEPIESFRAFEMLYADAIFGGPLSSIYDRLFSGICGSHAEESSVLRLLADPVMEGEGSMPVQVPRARFNLSDEQLAELLGRLNVEEVIRLSSNRIEKMQENRILLDYLAVRGRLELKGEVRATVYADTLADLIKRAPAEMARYYRRRTAVGLRELMSRFDSREVPAAFFDYGIFRDSYKGLPDAEVRNALAADKERILLPEIVFSAHTEAFYRAIGLVTERERSAVAIGFEQADFAGDQTTAWIAAELESKLEASARLTESWCDRLETAAAVCGFKQFRLWLIAPEGFSPEALEVIASRGGFGSSRRQADLLAAFLADEPAVETIEAEEYEITIPMSADAEMVSAHTIEDIARRHKIAAKDINQIKTALVEACINAVEHSHSPDRRIHQKFAVAPDRVTITVSNRGVRLADKVLSEIEPDEGRRGWGLKLMRNLMDDVRIEQADDGTRISMTKYLKRV